MENATDALKIAFAIFMFVLSLTLLFMAVTRTKTTADRLYYYSDKTNFYKHTQSSANDRIVTVPDIISTIYKYDTELISVKVVLNELDGLGKKKEYTFDLDEKTEAEKEQRKQDITTCVNKLAGKSFTEEFVEVPVTGIYIESVDGTEITIASGAKKVYVTYREYPPT